MRRFIPVLTTLLFLAQFPSALAKDYAIFDGQTYNGLYYPRIDIIEWGKPPHLEFHVYSKDEPIEIEAKPVDRGGKRVLMVNYYFTKRKEKICRSVIAPANFSTDAKLYFYKDGTDNEYDNIYVSVNPQQTSKNIQSYANRDYSAKDCDGDQDAPGKAAAENANAANSNGGRGVASTGNGAPATLTESSDGPPNAKNGAPQAAPAKKKDMIDYENNAMPYNF